MNFLKSILGRKEQWVEFDTLYSTQRLERLRIFMAEKTIFPTRCGRHCFWCR